MIIDSDVPSLSGKRTRYFVNMSCIESMYWFPLRVGIKGPNMSIVIFSLGSMGVSGITASALGYFAP